MSSTADFWRHRIGKISKQDILAMLKSQNGYQNKSDRDKLRGLLFLL